jgi:hypothetical protein
LSKGPNEGVWLRIVLREGKKRQIRHMTAAVGYPTLRLLRWSIGPLTLGNLELGQFAPLTLDEINGLRQMAELPPIAQPKPPRSTVARNRPGDKRAGAVYDSKEQAEKRRAAARGPGPVDRRPRPGSNRPRPPRSGGQRG